MYKIITEHSVGAKKNKGRSMKIIPKWLQEEMNKYKI
jgi:hypothetical protein